MASLVENGGTSCPEASRVAADRASPFPTMGCQRGGLGLARGLAAPRGSVPFPTRGPRNPAVIGLYQGEPRPHCLLEGTSTREFAERDARPRSSGSAGRAFGSAPTSDANHALRYGRCGSRLRGQRIHGDGDSLRVIRRELASRSPLRLPSSPEGSWRSISPTRPAKVRSSGARSTDPAECGSAERNNPCVAGSDGRRWESTS
jgi:hypothetical protein